MNVYVETDKGKEIQYGLLNPHYTDGRFQNGTRTVFLVSGYHVTNRYGTDAVEGLSYVYSDRLVEWYEKSLRDQAWTASSRSGNTKDSAAYIEAFLRELFKDSGLVLVHIVTGVNVSNGYPYRAYGYLSSPK